MDARTIRIVDKLSEDIMQSFREIAANEFRCDDDLGYIISLVLSAHLSSLVNILKNIGDGHPEVKKNIENVCDHLLASFSEIDPTKVVRYEPRTFRH